MKSNLLSTQEVAVILNVAETTIKSRNFRCPPGVRTQMRTLSSAQRLSQTSVRHPRELIEKLRKLASQVHAYNGKLLIGGQYAQNLSAEDVKCDHLFRQFRASFPMQGTQFN